MIAARKEESTGRVMVKRGLFNGSTMSVVLPLKKCRRSAPPLVFAGLFEARADTRTRNPDAEQVLANCRRLLEQARATDWPLAFTVDAARLHQGPEPAGWIDGFRPRPADMLFETRGDSCYADPAFADAMTAAGRSFLLAGLSGNRTCLATLIEAPAYGHHGGLVEDACYVAPLKGLDAPASRRALAAVASSYATTLTTADLMTFGVPPSPGKEAFHA